MAGISTTHFVDPVNGSDANNGSSEGTAWQTVTKACQSAQSGSLVLFRGGTYASVNGITGATGRSQAATFMPYPGESVIFGSFTFGRASTTSNDGNRHCTHVRIVGINGSPATRWTFGWGCKNMEALGCWIPRIQIQDGVQGVWIEDNTMICEKTEANTSIFFAGDDIEPQIEDVRIRRNYIEPDIVGINIRGFRDVIVEDNEITGVTYYGATHTDVIRTFGGGSKLAVRRNYLHDNEGLGFFTKDGTTRDVTFENNVITRMQGGFSAFNIYTTHGLWVANNVIDGPARFGFATTDSTGVVLVNNIFTGSLVDDPFTGPNTQFAYRNYNWIGDNTEAGSFANEANGIRNVTPVFEDAAGGDFRLTSGQPGVNTGAAGPVLGRAIPALDHLGLPRPVGAAPDMGAFERQA